MVLLELPGGLPFVYLPSFSVVVVIIQRKVDAEDGAELMHGGSYPARP